MHVRENGAHRPHALDPADRLRDAEVAAVQRVAERADDPDFEAADRRERLLRKIARVARISERAEAEAERLDLAMHLAGADGAVRVIAYVVSGIGFLGAGVIMKQGMDVRGLNTAATLWFPNMAAAAEFLPWAGSHLGVTFSPDNKFLVTAMHEPALHGWRLADNRHMRMTGYPGRVRSMSWTAGGKALATSGADTVILGPFASKDGPMGKEPAMLAPLQARVSVVACHPRNDILAAGYSDGTILMVRLEDGAEILVRRNGTAPVAALAWNPKGTLLAFADETGDAGIFPL